MRIQGFTKSVRLLTALALAGTLVAAPLVLPGRAVAAKRYTFYLSNTFVGNDWRVQMEREGGDVCRPSAVPPDGARPHQDFRRHRRAR